MGVWRTKNERLQEINTTKALHTHHVAMSGSHVLIMWNVCENKSEGRNEANIGVSELVVKNYQDITYCQCARQIFNKVGYPPPHPPIVSTHYPPCTGVNSGTRLRSSSEAKGRVRGEAMHDCVLVKKIKMIHKKISSGIHQIVRHYSPSSGRPVPHPS